MTNNHLNNINITNNNNNNNKKDNASLMPISEKS